MRRNTEQVNLRIPTVLVEELWSLKDELAHAEEIRLSKQELVGTLMFVATRLARDPAAMAAAAQAYLDELHAGDSE